MVRTSVPSIRPTPEGTAHASERPAQAPRLVRYLLINCLTGLLAGALTGAGLLVGNVAGLADLMRAPGEGAVAPVLLVLFFALTFGTLAMGVSVMALSNARGSVWGPLHRHYVRMADELKPGPAAFEPVAKVGEEQGDRRD
ncbi:MAG: hypothetical protein GC150_11700 [Rhizobiales bacterium]|nr:hypothetical protein [Hyphomicrobiales bacterium]